MTVTRWTPLPASALRHDGERRGEGLALAGLHLGDVAVVQHHAADQLDVEVAHAHRARAGLAGEREALGQQVVEGLAVLAARSRSPSIRSRSSSSVSS